MTSTQAHLQTYAVRRLMNPQLQTIKTVYDRGKVTRDVRFVLAFAGRSSDLRGRFNFVAPEPSKRLDNTVAIAQHGVNNPPNN